MNWDNRHDAMTDALLILAVLVVMLFAGILWAPL